MKIVHFTPVNKKSAIARMAKLVTHELIQLGHDVTIVCSENIDNLSEYPTEGNSHVLLWNEIEKVDKLLQSTDGIVYQVGNNYSFHRGCLEWMHRYPGVVILHDYYVAHLFNFWTEFDVPKAREIVRSLYGEAAPKLYFKLLQEPDFIENTYSTFPMTEWISRMALGVVTHSSYGIQRILQSCSGPVYTVPLAYDAPDVGNEFEKNNNKIQLLTVGHMNRNKKIDTIIRSIGSSDLLKKNTDYHLVGSITREMNDELSSLALELGVNVYIYGEVSDEELIYFRHLSDITCCLRNPCLESASASAIESMLYGKPTIVMNDGFYSELPNDCVIKINSQSAINDIKNALEYLLGNPEQCKAIGKKAKLWSEQIFTAANYSHQLINILEEVNKIKPTKAAIEYFSAIASQWSNSSDVLINSELITPLHIFATI